MILEPCPIKRYNGEVDCKNSFERAEVDSIIIFRRENA